MSLVDENLFVSQYLHLLSQRAVRYAADHASPSPSFSPKLKKSVQPPGVERTPLPDAIEQKTAVEPVPAPATASTSGPSPTVAATSTSPITFTVKTLKPPATYTITLLPSDTVHTLKHRLHQQTGIATAQQRLVLKGKALLDPHVLSEYGLTEGSTVYLKTAEAPQAPSQTQTHASQPASASQLEIQQPGDMGLTYRGSARVREAAFWVNLRKTLGQEFVDQGDAEKVLVEFMGLYKEILGKLTPIEIEAIVGGSK